jgi:hypothetical protein
MHVRWRMQMMIFISDTSTRFVVAAATWLTHSELFLLKISHDLGPGLTQRQQSYEPLARRRSSLRKISHSANVVVSMRMRFVLSLSPQNSLVLYFPSTPTVACRLTSEKKRISLRYYLSVVSVLDREDSALGLPKILLRRLHDRSIPNRSDP